MLLTIIPYLLLCYLLTFLKTVKIENDLLCGIGTHNTCNPGTQNIEMEVLEVSGQPGLHCNPHLLSVSP